MLAEKQVYARLGQIPKMTKLGPNYQARCKKCGQVLDLFEEGYVGMRAHLLQRHQIQIGDYYTTREYFTELEE